MTPRPGRTSPPGWPAPHPQYSPDPSRQAPAPDPADVVLQFLATALASRLATGHASQDNGPQPMLTVAQTAALLGVSRMTVIRMADAGQLPCVVIARGDKKKTRRFPRKFIEEMSSGTSPQDHTNQWLGDDRKELSK